MDYRKYFRGKKITQLGLGLLGRGTGDAAFLAECGADLIVTDLKTEEELKPSLSKLAAFVETKSKHQIKFVLGEHRLADFKNRDFILKAAGVPLNSPHIAEARKNGIPIEMDASLFAKLAPEGVTLIGVTGTRGKSTVTQMIYDILKKSSTADSSSPIGNNLTITKKVYLGGNVRDMATLPLLASVKAGDFVVLELDSWQLQGFEEAGISPNVAVFTTFYPDHMNYYGSTGSPQVAMEKYFEDKANIFKFQKSRASSDGARHDSAESDILVAGEQAAARVRGARPPVAPIIAFADDVPADWKLKILGEHNRANAACAIAAARALKIPEEIIRRAVENFSGLEGRLQFLREINGVKIYNDNNATTPDATLAALRALSGHPPGRNPVRTGSRGNENPGWIPPPEPDIKSASVRAGAFHEDDKRIILIMGGADKNLDMAELVAEIPKFCKAVILLPGSGSEKLLTTNYLLLTNAVQVKNLNQALDRAHELATVGDIILFSPAFASFGMFKNEYDRGEQFMKIVKSL